MGLRNIKKLVVASIAAFSAGAACAAPLEVNVVARATPAEVKSMQERREAVFDRMMADPSNLDLAFEYAALSAKMGDLEGAISTLERMLIFAPGLQRIQVELGVLYFRLGAYEQAAGYLEDALSKPVPPAVQTRIEAYLAVINKRTKTNVFSGVTLFGGRYQSNANAAPSSQYVDLNGIDFLLGENASPDVNAYASGSYAYTHDLQRQGDRLVATLATYSAVYADRSELDTGLAEITVGPAFDMQRVHIDNSVASFYAIAGGTILAGDLYYLSGGAGASFSKGFGPATRVSVKAEYRYEDYDNSNLRPRASDRTGDRIRVAASAQRNIWERFSVSGGLTGERRDVEVGYLSLWEAGATMGATWVFDSPIASLELPWSFAPVLGYKYRDYDSPDPLISSREQRDHEGFVQGTLTVPFNEMWGLQASASYRDVSSNYDLSDFNNISGSLAVMRKF